MTSRLAQNSMVISGFLHSQYGGVNKTCLNSSGNFVIIGDLFAFGTI